MKDFVHLRVHSQYSVGFGTLFISATKKEPDRPNLIKFCKESNMHAVAITDNNLMSGTAELSDKAPANGIQPIIGVTLTLNHHNADPKFLRDNQMSKVVLLAKNHDGYLNLCKLSKIMYMRQDNWHLGPYITFEELASLTNGLICLSGGHTGPIGMSILENQETLAEQLADKFLSMFDNRFYMELSRHGLDEQIKTEPVFLRIAREKNIPIVATNDVVFARPENYEAADALHCILGQTKVISEDRARANVEQYFKSPIEMSEIFSDLPEALENTINISKRCAFAVNVKEKPLLPHFCEDEGQVLHDNVMDGLKKRFAEHNITDTQKYLDQANFEVDVINGMGFPGYFLIVRDYIMWAEDNGISVGPGRGSGAGSVVSWALGITKLDPLKYGLLFERFLNPDRISMPDFDIDFEPTGIEKILDYIRSKYGNDRICRIITFGTLQARGAIRDVGRVYGMPYSKSDRFSKLIPGDVSKLKDAMESRDIKEALADDVEMQKVVNVACELEGTLRNIGQHAAGVVIGDRPTVEIAPIYRDPSNVIPSSQFNAPVDGSGYLEPVGLIKFDFLGLETLTIIKYAIGLIRENYGIDINPELIPDDDEKTYKNVWQKGQTLGIFQFDAPHVQKYLINMQPNCFDNITALNALNRPGPAAFIPSYIARLRGDEKVEYPHPVAEDILKETYGIYVYQEQIMLLSRVLAGFTRGESDVLRKGISKKVKAILDTMKIKFVEGCTKQNTLTPDQAEDMWIKWEEFAKYAFNKSHSLCYAVIANQCAWLKANYPAEFIAAGMSSELNDTDYIHAYVQDARNNFNVDIIPPDINESESLFSVKKGKIVFGLCAIKGVGKAATDLITTERFTNGEFRNLTDFAKRTAGILNKRILENFVKAGVLDRFCPDRAKLYYNADAILLYAAKQKEGAQTLSLFENTTADDTVEDTLLKQLANSGVWGFNEKLAFETEALGFSLQSSPLDPYKKLISAQGLLKGKDLAKQGDRKSVRIAINVTGFNRRTTKTGKPMLIVKGTDDLVNVDAVAFGESVFALETTLRESATVVIAGRTGVREDNSVSLFVDTIIPIEEWAATVLKKMIITITDKSKMPDLKRLIDALPNGLAKITMKISDGEREAVLALPRGIRMLPDTMMNLSTLGIKTEIE